MLCASILVLVSVVLSFIPASDGCSCLFRHPQEVVCDSDFVIKGVQVGQEIIPLIPDELPVINGRVIYFLIKNVIKGHKIEPGDIMEIRTGLSSVTCAVNVPAGETWLLTGRTSMDKGNVQYSISLCDWNTRCSQLTAQQRSFLLNRCNLYFGRGDINCKKCKIVRCPNNDCSTVKPTAGQCLQGANQCFSKTLRCQFTNNSCQWRSTQDAKKCINS